MLGETISHYKILEKLGQGGMGEVYLAEDTRLGRKVALKFLAPELARDRESLARFRNEAKAAAELSHPNIATIYDIGESADRPYLVLEYLRGQSLRQRIQQSPLPVDDTLRIGRSLAEGLAAAHAHAIVHRDIKSANIMITDEGGVKILDFGLARLGDATQLTRPGTTLGTIYYMSPEQALGRAADERSDIWSLGVVLYEMLTGRLPFQGEGVSVLEQIKLAEPDAPTGLRSGIPLELEQAILRCLEKDPALRYQHADDLLANLRVVEKHLQITDSDRTVRVTSVAARRRFPLLRISFVAAIVLLLVAAAVWYLPRRSHQDVAPLLTPAEFSLAVIDFQEAAPTKDVSVGLMMTNLVQGGLIQSSPCRVLTLEYLKDIRRRRFGETSASIGAEQALEIARMAGASALVFADVLDSRGDAVLSWRLVDARTGEALGAGRCRSPEIFALADSTVAGILPVLAQNCGVTVTGAPEPVSSTSTSSPEAYEHYLAGRQAVDREESGRPEFELALSLDPDFALAYFALSQDSNVDARELLAEEAWERRERLTVIERLRLEAWRMRLGNRLGDARRTYEEILARWPDDLGTIKDLSMTLYLYGNTEEALQVAERGLSLYPDDDGLLNSRINCLIALWQPSRAIEAALSLPERFSTRPDYWDDLGVMYLQLGQLETARKQFLRALEIAPDYMPARTDLAFTSFCEGKLGKAIEETKALLESDAHSNNERSGLLGASAYYLPGLGELHRLAGQSRLALEALDLMRALSFESDSDRWRSEYNIGMLLLRWGYPERALPIARGLARKVHDGPTEQRGTRLLARCLVAVDSLDRAREQVQRIQQWEGGLFVHWAHWTSAEIALAEGRADDALRELAVVRFLMGRYDIEIRELRARAQILAGRPLDAATTLEELVKIYGGYAPAHYLLGSVYEAQGRWDDARAAYERFLELWSDADEDQPQLLEARRRIANLDSRTGR